MTILFYHDSFKSIFSGGIDRITFNIASLISQRNIKVLFLSRNGQYIGFNKISELCMSLPEQKVSANANVKYVKDILARHHVDIIINQSAMSREHLAFLYKCIEGNSHIKLISCIHNLVITPGVNWGLTHEYILRKKHLGVISKIAQTTYSKTILKRLYILKYRRHYRNLDKSSDAIIGLCPGHLKEIEEMLGYKSSKLVLIPNCIPNENIKEIEEKDKIILWVGRTDFSIKRLDIMIHIWHKIESIMPDWELYVLGSGGNLELAKKISQQLSLKRIHFEGNVNPSEYYKKASITCVTSSHESFSMVILESQTYSVVPIVFNTFPAARFLVDNNINGILVDSYDIETYIKKIYELSKNELKLKEMQHAAYCSSKTYGASNVCDKWLELFEQICPRI